MTNKIDHQIFDQLLSKAGIQFDKDLNNIDVCVMLPADLVKFASLIINQCAIIADDPDVDMLRIGNAIKQYFGVK